MLAERGGPILLTGATGQIGRELLRSLAPLGKVVTPTRSDFPLDNEASVRRMVRLVRPRWIVNAAAYTEVDRAEGEPEVAYAVNATAVGAMAEEARILGAGLLHFSTDYVFDGRLDRPYLETDLPAPVNVYGASKLEGERKIASSGTAAIIFRTSWVFGGHGANFLLKILRLARERETLRVVADQHGAPTWSRELARSAVRAIEVSEASIAGMGGGSGEKALAPYAGIYHATSAGETTWHGFAAAAVRMAAAANPQIPFASIEPITSAAYPTRARRPANSRLDCTKLSERLCWQLPSWQDSLTKVMAEMRMEEGKLAV